MRDDLQILRELIAAATAIGVNDALLRRSARALLNLIEAPTSRKAETLERGRRINQLRAQRLTPAEIRERLDLTVDQMKYADKVVRDCHTTHGARFPQPTTEVTTVDLKSSSINLGGAIAPMSKYGATPRPAAPTEETPRDAGGMSTGKTSGNFTAAKIPNLQVAPGVASEDAK